MQRATLPLMLGLSVLLPSAIHAQEPPDFGLGTSRSLAVIQASASLALGSDLRQSADNAIVSRTVGHEAAAALASSFRSPRDYRWEGALIGGLSLGVGMSLVGLGVCSDLGGDGCLVQTLGFGLMGATVGVVVGGLVGSLVPKDPGRKSKAAALQAKSDRAP